jgi:hypothetical protein
MGRDMYPGPALMGGDLPNRHPEAKTGSPNPEVAEPHIPADRAKPGNHNRRLAGQPVL